MDRYYSDQEIYNMGFDSRAAFNRRMKAEETQRVRDQQREDNTAVGHEPRRSDRFMPAGAAGVPISKNRLAERIHSESEEKARELFQRIMLHKRAGIPVNHDKAALGTILGYTVGTIREFESYINSDAARERFGEIG